VDRATFNAVEAANVSGLTYRQVVGALVHGRLRGKRVGAEWRVTRRALETYVAEMRLAAEQAVERYAVAGRMGDAMRGWWHRAMGTAQLEAADAARAFASTHTALHRQVTANGQAEPALAKRIAAQLATSDASRAMWC
jgi:hypothetical protein